jgi:hypothetical protein
MTIVENLQQIPIVMKKGKPNEKLVGVVPLFVFMRIQASRISIII